MSSARPLHSAETGSEKKAGGGRKKKAGGGRKPRRGNPVLKATRFLTRNQAREVQDIFTVMSVPIQNKVMDARADMERQLLVTRADLDRDTFEMRVGLYKAHREIAFSQEEVKVHNLKGKVASLTFGLGLIVGITGVLFGAATFIFK